MADAAALYESVLKRLEGGGATLQADLADIEAGKKSAIATGAGNLISAGLGGTTVMGAVPLAAEKTAGRARLKARGGAEDKYMTALMSFANLAESSKQMELNRRAGRQGMVLGSQLNQPPAPGTAASPYDVFGRYKEGRGPSGGTGGTGGTGTGGQAGQFPSLYGQSGGGLPAVPNWGGGGTDWEAKRLADEAQAQKLQGLGRLTFDPAQIESQVKEMGMASMPKSAQGDRPTHETSFQSYFNYSATLRNKTGETLSQQAAYSKLYG